MENYAFCGCCSCNNNVCRNDVSGRYTKMAEAAKVSGRTACDCMRAGDEAAKEVYDKYIHYLAIGLGNVINIFTDFSYIINTVI